MSLGVNFKCVRRISVFSPNAFPRANDVCISKYKPVVSFPTWYVFLFPEPHNPWINITPYGRLSAAGSSPLLESNTLVSLLNCGVLLRMLFVFILSIFKCLLFSVFSQIHHETRPLALLCLPWDYTIGFVNEGSMLNKTTWPFQNPICSKPLIKPASVNQTGNLSPYTLTFSVPPSVPPIHHPIRRSIHLNFKQEASLISETKGLP